MSKEQPTYSHERCNHSNGVCLQPTAITSPSTKAAPKPTSVELILLDFLVGHTDTKPSTWAEHDFSVTISALKQLLLGAMPEKQYPTDSITSSVRLMGYNTAIDQYKAKIEELMG